MVKRKFVQQLQLPFDLDIVEQTFGEFKPMLAKWHEFIKKNGYGNGEYFWWRSRYSEWIQELRSQGIGFEVYHEKDKLFPRIWERFEKEFTGRCLGVPSDAY